MSKVKTTGHRIVDAVVREAKADEAIMDTCEHRVYAASFIGCASVYDIGILFDDEDELYTDGREPGYG